MLAGAVLKITWILVKYVPYKEQLEANILHILQINEKETAAMDIIGITGF